MKNKLLRYPPKFSVQNLLYKTAVLLQFLCLSFSAAAITVNTENKVSQDIASFNAFEVQSKSLAASNQGVFVTIGADGACDFDSAVDSIQDAIDEGSIEVRVASNGTYQNNLILENQSVVIRGGFADCDAAIANKQKRSDLTVIDGSLLAEPVVYISGSDMTQQIRLENLVLQGGTSLFPKFGGGLSVDLAAVGLQLWRVEIRNNAGSEGAGIYINAGLGTSIVDTSIMGRDVIIHNNHSSSDGGGLHCVGSVDISFSGMSLINNNIAALGGGAFLGDGCIVSMYTEHYEDSLSFISGIFFNQSLSNGGGVYIFNGSQLYLFGQQMCNESGCLGSSQIPVYLYGNEAGLSSGQEGDGGGFYIAQSENQNNIYANGLILTGNTARQNGGGGYLDSNGKVVVERLTGGCWNPDRCNQITDNSSGIDTGLGGAFYVADEGELSISQSYIEGNRADFGTAINITGESAVVTLEGTVLSDNGDNGKNNFSDINLIRASMGAAVLINHSTLIDNKLQSSVFDMGAALSSTLVMFNSIVHDPDSGDLFGSISGPLNISCLLAHEDSTFNGVNVVVGEPQFIDRLGGNFHLSSISPAIDMCQSVPSIKPLDIDAETRGWDDPDNNNGLGVFDAGADESYVNDVIFENDFEA